MISTTLSDRATAAGRHQAVPRPGHGFRTDIQGLRALAVGSVVLYHLWPKQLTGGFVGVDVFFVISGFLITSHLLSKPPRSARDVAAFWAKRVKRLLPASLLVLAATLLATALFAPASVWENTAAQVRASALYVQNWALAASSVDYLAAEDTATAVQHFWSLSVEEQFYFVWPVVIGLLLALGSRLGRAHLSALLGLSVVALGGLWLSITLTASEPAAAYFVSWTRLWELAAGGLTAALVLHRPASGGIGAALVSWMGLGGIVLAVFITDPAAPFPGTAAILPVVATALVLGAHATHRNSATALLSVRPAQFLGDLSYSLYLWHWPVIVLAPYVLGELGWRSKLGVLAGALVLAWLTTLLVERRFRRSIASWGLGKTFIAAGLAMAVVVGGATGLGAAAQAQQSAALSALARAEADPNACVGAAALEPGAHDKASCQNPALLLGPAAAKTDKSNAYRDKCWSNQPYDKRPVCTYGNGKTQVALIGNSHAGQWLPALEKIAAQRDWTISTYLVSRCNVSDAPQQFDTAQLTKACSDYGAWVKKQTTNGSVDLVITSERQSVPVLGETMEDSGPAARAGYRGFLEAWHQAKVPVVVLRDTPFPGKNIPDCVAGSRTPSKDCAGSADAWRWMDPLAAETQALGLPGQRVIQTEQWFCPGGRCAPVIGGLVVYFDNSHITASYARSLTSALSRALDAVGVEG